MTTTDVQSGVQPVMRTPIAEHPRIVATMEEHDRLEAALATARATEAQLIRERSKLARRAQDAALERLTGGKADGDDLQSQLAALDATIAQARADIKLLTRTIGEHRVLCKEIEKQVRFEQAELKQAYARQLASEASEQKKAEHDARAARIAEGLPRARAIVDKQAELLSEIERLDVDLVALHNEYQIPMPGTSAIFQFALAKWRSAAKRFGSLV